MLMAVKDMGIPMERYCVSTVIVVSPVLVDAVVLDMGEGEPPYDPSVSWPGDGTGRWGSIYIGDNCGSYGVFRIF